MGAERVRRGYNDRPVEAEYLKAEIAEDEGFVQAIAKFQKGARGRDIDTIFCIAGTTISGE